MTAERKLAAHPKGLYVLFFTEMWERFGYYLMLGIFSLYMLDSLENGGMGFSGAKKSDIYGTYIGLVYLTPFIGGLLADRILGYRRSIFLGGSLMAAGYLGLSIHNETAFYVSLLLIILGNGFFKPNISTLVGNLYNDPRYIANKDSGYNIFYMGINIGAFICNFVAAFLRNNYGWGFAFIAAGIGMIIGLIVFASGTRHVKEADTLKPVKPGDMGTGVILAATILPMFVFGIIGYFLKGVGGDGNIFGTDTNDAFIFGCIPVIGFFLYLMFSADKEDRGPIAALLSVYGCIVVFWAVFHQNGDALTVWAEEYTDREMPAAIAKPANAIGMTQNVTYFPELGMSEEAFTHHLDSLKVEASKLEAGSDASKELNAHIGSLETSKRYFENLPADERPAEGKDLKLVSTEIYQSVNPFWVIVLTPLVVGVFSWLRRRKKEPTTPGKIAIGLVITALSALVMVMAVKSTNLDDEKASSMWLIATYGVITIGELCLSPMGLSLVSKLSPPRLTALMMGGFFLSTSVGNKLAGILSSNFEATENKDGFFLTNFALVMVAAVMMFLLLRWLNRVMREKGLV
ncbi:MAG: peptide MFS transporter [Chitinophagales bacterium]|nr:peptide MFS transporter [Chitinophagales bacterium]HQU39834.1 peptide MFS transporter [Chitinophagales bacterium]HQU76358.1 peptide MFS transporter [Chitinophagales bacterium]